MSRLPPQCSLVLALALTSSCSSTQSPTERADLLITNANVYTLAWGEPDSSGLPAADAPRTELTWKGDAQAVAIREGRILFAGTAVEAERFREAETRVIDVEGATVLPGLIDSHVHVANLGAILSRVDLRGVETEEEAVERVRRVAEETPPGEWIVGWGWDEGAWADRYPDLKRLSEAVPDHPVSLKGLHGFAIWTNQLALERAGITGETRAPEGGEIRKDARGHPTGILLNRAVRLVEDAMPPPTPEELQERVLAGLRAMAEAGYVSVHEAGAGRELMAAFEALEAAGRLPIRVYAMLSAREGGFLREWIEKGPDRDPEAMLVTRSVKAFYDGALGSRGALLLEDYSNQPGHRGVSGDQYGFDEKLLAEAMRRGFQVAIHAIGDAGNRETLDFFASVFKETPAARENRHRIEHAQVLHPDDIPRFAELDVIASMEPGHAVEDMVWAEDRLGPERVRFAYAWRSLRKAGARIIFNSDLPGSDHDIFYGLHAAVTRRDKEKQPPEGWYREQAVSPEEALRAYTIWAAYSEFAEERTGTIEPGKWADLTVMDIDPLAVGEADPGRLLEGQILMTIVAGRIVSARD